MIHITNGAAQQTAFNSLSVSTNRLLNVQNVQVAIPQVISMPVQPASKERKKKISFLSFRAEVPSGSFSVNQLCYGH